MAEMDVVALGAMAVDYYAVVPKLPEEDGKTTATEYKIMPGGVAGNVLTQTARLGLRSGWMGKLGNDSSGDILRAEFDKDGVDYSHGEIIPGKNSMFTWITVDEDGSRTIVMFPNVLAEFTAADVVQKHADYIRNSRVLQAEACMLPLSVMIAGLRIAKDAGVMTVFDLDVAPSEIERSNLGTKEELNEVLSLTDVLIPCKRAAQELIGSPDFEKDGHKLLGYGARYAAVTLGSKGCIVMDNSKQFVVPCVDAGKVIDTTGAGDAFHGGMIYGILSGMPLEMIGRFANACGGMNCTKIGARSMGTLDEINALLD